MTLTKKEEKKLDILMGKQFDIEFDISSKVQTLVIAKWNAPTLKKDIEKYLKRRDKIYAQVGPLHEKSECDKKKKKIK